MDGTVDLDALEAYLSSDESPDDCMDLSELDGFLAGKAVPQGSGCWLQEALKRK